MELKSYKPYKLRIKGREPIHLGDRFGEQVRDWWKTSRPSDKLNLHDDHGGYVETILSSQIEGIERKTAYKAKEDENGKIGVEGFICDWGEFHTMDVMSQENCGCLNKYNAHHSQMFAWIKHNYPNTTISTSKDFTKEMKNNFLLQKNG
jgi:hypothetical protein